MAAESAKVGCLITRCDDHKQLTWKFNEERSKQALDAARAENLRVGKIHADLDERFGKYRAEKASLRPARAPVIRHLRSSNSNRSFPSCRQITTSPCPA